MGPDRCFNGLLEVRHKKQLLRTMISAIVMLAFMSPLSAFGQECLNTQRAKIIYTSPADLQEMDRRLNVNVMVAAAISAPNPLSLCQAQDPIVLRLGAKIDALLSKVAGLLKLNEKTRPRLSIRLLQNGHQVTQIFQLFQPLREKPLFGYGSMEAFYETRSHTIFLSLKDLHEGILAHEMAHFLLCTGKFTPPPEYYQEEVSQYVESRIN